MSVVEICFKIEKFSEAFSQYHSKDSKNKTCFPDPETGSHYTGTVTITKEVTLTRWRVSTGDLRKGVVTKIRF